MADCIICGGPNNYNLIADPVESFKQLNDIEGYPWNPQTCKHNCCPVVCETCCRGYAKGGGDCTSQCIHCRQRLNLWVVVNVLGRGGVTE